jgi:hypothetical protein
VKFLSRSTPDVPEVTPAAEADEAHHSGKGRPTPTRKEAEAQRKQSLKVPSDPKAAKKAARARAAQEREVARAGLMSGDERYLPARDQGPVRAYVRDFIDGRWAAAELFLPLALVVLIVGFLPVPNIQGYVSTAWLFMTLFIVVDTTLLMFRLSRQLTQRWPVKAERKGAIFYAVMRVLQLRRLRLPKPKVRPGGKPVKPPKSKEPKGPAAK